VSQRVDTNANKEARQGRGWGERGVSEVLGARIRHRTGGIRHGEGGETTYGMRGCGQAASRYQCCEEGWVWKIRGYHLRESGRKA